MSFVTDVIGSTARAGLTWLSRRSLPQTSGTLTLPGLHDKIEIIRDRWGIPHIYASNRHDLFYAQGFVHAQDRLWQMELNRRTAQGRLSELFGDLALETDRLVRTLGFNRLGQSDWMNLSEEVREILLAYTTGVNAFIGSHDTKLPVEFSLLRHEPERWSPQDSTAFSRVMIWQLSHAWYGEIVRAQIADAIGKERAAELEIHYPETNPVSLPAGIDFNRLDASGRLRKATGPFLDRGKGSNAWVVSGRKTTTGSPILCNDMHLALKLPSIWYEVHLQSDGFHASGVSLPGVPLVLVGHNDRIAWGATLAYTDCEDLFVEQEDPETPHRFLFQEEWEEARVIKEPIRVKGRPQPIVEKVIVTRHGPIISDVVGYPQQRLAVNSMALRPCLALSGWLKLNTSGCWDEFVEAVRLIEAPQLNIAYADVHGNIGYWVTGKVPVRAKGCGNVPAPGWTGEYEWTGEVPFEEMPHALNPKQNFVITCNNKIVPGSYPHFLGNVWMNGYRAARIESILKSKKELSIEELCAIHLDVTCLPGRELVARLEGLESEDPDVRLALDRLRAWDGRLDPESVGGALYEVTRYSLARGLYDPCLGPDLALRVMGQGFHPLLFFAHEFYGHDTVTLLRLLDQPGSWWMEKAGGRQALLEHSLKQAIEWLRGELGADPDGWQWGKIHCVTFEHPLGLQKPLDLVFNRGPYPIGGDTDTPCQTAMLPGAPYDNKAWSPTFRMVVDLGDLSRSIAVAPPGQSGQLGSPHYDNMIEPWLKGEYHPMLWTREQVEAEARDRLVLVT
jgi:penicillin amidase